MKNLFYILIVILLLNLFLYNAYTAQTFTLEECISLALKNNDSIKASLSDMEMHAHETSMYYSEFFPRFSSNVQYTIYDREPSLIIEKNASLHPKKMGQDIRIVPGVVKAFLTDNMRKLIKDHVNTGILSIEDAFEGLPQGFDFEISKKLIIRNFYAYNIVFPNIYNVKKLYR